MKRIVFALALGGLLTACYPEGTTPTPSASGSPTSGTVAGAKTVTIKDSKFSPASVTVQVGDSVTFVNEDSAPHTATAKDNSFDTGSLSKGQSKTIKFEKAGTADYFCRIHPNMTGSVTVQ